jgi:hypothetical protein
MGTSQDPHERSLDGVRASAIGQPAPGQGRRSARDGDRLRNRASALIGLISTAVVFPAAAFTATLVYLGVVGLEMSLLERELAAEPAQDGRSAQ